MELSDNESLTDPTDNQITLQMNESTANPLMNNQIQPPTRPLVIFCTNGGKVQINHLQAVESSPKLILDGSSRIAFGNDNGGAAGHYLPDVVVTIDQYTNQNGSTVTSKNSETDGLLYPDGLIDMIIPSSKPKPEDTIVPIEPKIWTPFQPTTITASNQIFVICNFSRLLEIHKSSSDNNINHTFVRFIIQAIGTASLAPIDQVAQPEYIPTDNQTALIYTLNQNLLKYVAERNANMDFVRTLLDAIAIAASKEWGVPNAVDQMLSVPKESNLEFDSIASPSDPLIESTKVPVSTYTKQDSMIYIHIPIKGNGHKVKLDTSGIATGGSGKKKDSLWKRVWNFVKPVFVCTKCFVWCV